MKGLSVTNLKCDQRVNPIGIDNPKPCFSWELVSELNDVMQVKYHIQVATDTDFSNVVWDVCVNSAESVCIIYAGAELKDRTQYVYRVLVEDAQGAKSPWSEAATFETAFLAINGSVTSAIKARFISGDKATQTTCPVYAKTFALKPRITRARVYATALGIYELYINGARVGADYLTPGWTDYKTRLQYQTYDVTDMLRSGENQIKAMTGPGWFKGELAWEDRKGIYGKTSAVLLQMHIDYADGTSEIIVTDEGFKTCAGPVLFSEIYHGETYDASLEDLSGAAWHDVEVVDYPIERLIAQENYPVRAIQGIKPIELIKTANGETVLDFGQNMVGVVQFMLPEGKAQKGDTVVLKHFEVLDADGNVYTENLRRARQTVEYRASGEGNEVYSPHFTFQGFRYVYVEQFPCEVSTEYFTGIVMHSDMEPTGEFECSDPMLNQLHHNILWGLKGNYVDVPTDCPQRDERLGWTGDAQAFISTACYLMNTAPFFKKWLNDLASDQLENGGVPFVIPNVLDQNAHSSSGWADAATICPWAVYMAYGETEALRRSYPSMRKWVDYIRNASTNGLLFDTGFHYGDWLALDAKEGSYFGATDVTLIATAFYAHSTQIVGKAAALLGYTDDAEAYTKLFDDIKTAFIDEFYTPNGRLASPTQTAHVLALNFGLYGTHKERTIKALVKYIEDNKFHLSTGFLGTPYLLKVLSENGYPEVAYKVLLQQDYPSWLYPITKGATTIWEHWDGIKPDGSMWSKDMNSFNHYAYGAVGDWIYSNIGGINIDPEKPAYKHSLIKPIPGGGITHSKAAIKTVYGRLSVEWNASYEMVNEPEVLKTFTIDITVPHNTTATLVMPGDSAKVYELCSGHHRLDM